MAVTIIPMEEAGDDGNFRYRVELDGVFFQHTLRYNARDAAWYLAIENTEGVVIRAGIKVVINWPLLRTVVTEGKPAGELIALDQRETVLDEAQDPDLEALGVDVLLAYVDEEGVLAAAS